MFTDAVQLTNDAPVQALVDAVDAIAKKAADTNKDTADAIVVPRQLLADLMLAMCIRTRVAEKFGAAGDVGHSYFISVLAYCWAVLRPLAASKNQKQNSTNEDETDRAANRFEALSVDDDDIENDEVVNIVNEPWKRSIKPPTAYSLQQDLIRGDDRFQALFIPANSR